MSNSTYRVLSIDGGGMRGLYTAAYLASLTQRYAVTRGETALDVGKGFNLITGNSTGAIVACAMAAGVSLDRIVSLYRERGPEIFPIKMPQGLGISLLWQLWARPRYLSKGAAALETALETELGHTTLGEIWNDRQIALAIPAVEMSRHHAWVFKTPHLPNTRHRDDGYRLVDACLATTAAPIYRSMAQIKNPDTPGHHVFVDGGLWANNPVLVGLIDALDMTQPGDQIEIFCLGTCPRPEGELVNNNAIDRGLGGWRFGGRAMSLAIDAQEYAFDNMARMIARHIDRDCQIIRFPHGKVPADIMRFLDLDETSTEAMDALVAQAQTDVYETLSRCGDKSDDKGVRLNNLFNSLSALNNDDQ